MQFAYALLHFTSGAEYNTSLRTHANKLNLSLSERGLFHKQPKGHHIPTGAKSIFKAASEAQIFARLQLVYEEPWERGGQVTPLASPALPLLE